VTDRAETTFALTSMRIGRTDLGSGTASVDEDALFLLVSASEDDRPVRVSLHLVDAIELSGGTVTIATRDGIHVGLTTAAAAELRAEIMGRCQAIPELTRALRAFGSRRGHRGVRDSASHEQQRFFGPLLDARRVAMSAALPSDAMAAFDATVLELAIANALTAFATERHGQNGPARRALEAELVDLTEPLRDSLDALRLTAVDAGSDMDNLGLWRAWSEQLRAAFETADRVWLSLDAALDAALDASPSRT
jgi:hypothetical protein